MNLQDGKVTNDAGATNTVSGTYDCQGNIAFTYEMKSVFYAGTGCEQGSDVQATCTVKGQTLPPPWSFTGTCSGTVHYWRKNQRSCSSQTAYDCDKPVSGIVQFHY